MRIARAAVLVVLSACPAIAQGVSEFVIPGRPDVPIVINGVDASWAVVESDLGLDRPGQITPTVIRRPAPVVMPYYSSTAYGPGYFPRNGQRPGYGRLEVVPGPNRPLPPPAPSFRQGWSSDSAPTPVTIYPPYAPPAIAPVVVGPGSGPHWHRRPAPHPPASPRMGNE